MRILLYIFGSILVAAGIAYLCIALLGLPPVWVGVGCLIIIGFGIMGAARTTASSKTVTTTAAPTSQTRVTEIH